MDNKFGNKKQFIKEIIIKGEKMGEEDLCGMMIHVMRDNSSRIILMVLVFILGEMAEVMKGQYLIYFNLQWKLNKMSGKGIFKWPDGRRY